MAKRGKSLCFIQFLPPELILRVFSNLDADSLLTSSLVSRQWRYLSRDNFLWRNCYCQLYGHPSEEPLQAAPGYWFSRTLKKAKNHRDKVIESELNRKNVTTVRHFQSLLQKLHVRFTLTVRDGITQFELKENDQLALPIAFVCRWYSCDIGEKLKSSSFELVLHGICALQMETKNQKKPWGSQYGILGAIDARKKSFRSLLTHMDVNDTELDLYKLAGMLLVAYWKRDGTVAFVTALIPYAHGQLAQRIAFGQYRRPYEPTPLPQLFDDIDSQFGLYGYQLEICLSNHRKLLWHHRFRNVETKHDQLVVVKDKIVFPLCDASADKLQNEGLYVGRESDFKFQLPWKTEAFKGIIKNLIIVHAVMIDYQGKLFWCMSDTIKVAHAESDESLLLEQGKFLQLSTDDVELNLKFQVQIRMQFDGHYEIIQAFV